MCALPIFQGFRRNRRYVAEGRADTLRRPRCRRPSPPLTKYSSPQNMTRRDIANRRWLGKSTERTGHDRVELAAKIATYLMNVARRLATGAIGAGRHQRTTETLAQCAQVGRASCRERVGQYV